MEGPSASSPSSGALVQQALDLMAAGDLRGVSLASWLAGPLGTRGDIFLKA